MYLRIPRVAEETAVWILLLQNAAKGEVLEDDDVWEAGETEGCSGQS